MKEMKRERERERERENLLTCHGDPVLLALLAGLVVGRADVGARVAFLRGVEQEGAALLVDAALGAGDLPVGHLPTHLGLWCAPRTAADGLLRVGGEHVVLRGAQVLNLCGREKRGREE